MMEEKVTGRCRGLRGTPAIPGLTEGEGRGQRRDPQRLEALSPLPSF